METVALNGLLAVTEKAMQYLDNTSVRNAAYSQSYTYISNDLGISVSQS